MFHLAREMEKFVDVLAKKGNFIMISELKYGQTWKTWPFPFSFPLYSTFKTKYILLGSKAPWPMSAIAETYNRGHNILELADILPNVSFTKSEMERDCY